MEHAAAPCDPKIILVGLNRCGTTSLHKLFTQSGVASVHWQDEAGRNIARVMMTNIGTGRKPLDGFGATRAFCDIAHLSGDVLIDGGRLFRVLHAAYPDAYFLLNTRRVEDWVSSRARHARGSYLTRTCKATGLTAEQVQATWRRLFTTHIDEVTAYFADAPRFMHFDIDTDHPEALGDWLAPDFDIDPAFWGHHNANRPNARTDVA